MMKKIFATLVAIMLVVTVSTSVFAASRNYSDWFNLDRLNATDVEVDLTEKANREEASLILAELCDELSSLPSKRVMEFEDDRDFESTSSYKMITRLSSTGIVTGYPDGEFKPENEITRAEALTMILRTIDYLSLETESYRRGSSFKDTEGHWAEVYCDRAYEHGLVSGRGNGRFYPDDEITREEIITILVNLMGESNNPLIAAIDKIYDLEFANPYYEEDDEDRYNDRYYDDDDDRYYDDDDEDEDRTERPVFDRDDYDYSSDDDDEDRYSSGSSKKPERPVVDLTTAKKPVNGDKPARPVVDLTTDNNQSTSVERPTVDVDDEETASSEKPARPIV